MRALAINVFARREELLAALRGGAGLRDLIRRMAALSLLCALAYGAVLGAQIGGWQMLASPVKLPMILLGTAGICVLALYVMLALAGARLTWAQVVGLSLCSVTASATTMLALLPITAFWTFAFGSGARTAVTLTHSGAFLLAGTVGTRFGLGMAAALLQERRPVRAVMLWLWVYGLVAQQMAWIFRPHFNPTHSFMRPLSSGGSALEGVFRMLLHLLR